MRTFGTYHQKFAIVKAGDERFGYCGGIDLNPNRLDDARHLAVGPYHDVHALVRGPAVRDLELSFHERWERDGGGAALAFEPAAEGTPAAAGGDAVQVARTYFKAANASRALAFAPDGDRTIADTLLRAIGEAREFISIEDQYFTLGTGYDYREALLAKVREGEIHTLLITLPAIGDQPFGELVRSGFIADLRTADAAAGGGIVRIGYPRRHYTLPDNELRAASGRLVLMRALDASGGVDPTIALGPKQRLPQVPFWLAVEGELMYAFDESTAPNPDPENAKLFSVVRGADTHLVRGGAGAEGSRTRTHPKDAAATVVDLASIYVHAKTMIVDDVFTCIGSANVNRRGHFHDGEINIFTVPQALKTARRTRSRRCDAGCGPSCSTCRSRPRNRCSRTRSPRARLFDRSPLLGNRFTDIEAYPTHLMFGATSADGLVQDVLKAILVTTPVVLDHAALYRAVIDPTSAVESA